MKSELSESGLRISLRFLDQKLCSIEVQSGHCYQIIIECFKCIIKQKELKRLFPCGVSMVAVVDDRDDVWLNSLDNLFKIEPYKYWKGTKEINNHTGSSLLEESKKKEISEKSNNDDDDNHNNKIATINPVATSNNNTLRFEQNEIDEQLNICYEILNKAHF